MVERTVRQWTPAEQQRLHARETLRRRMDPAAASGVAVLAGAVGGALVGFLVFLFSGGGPLFILLSCMAICGAAGVAGSSLAGLVRDVLAGEGWQAAPIEDKGCLSGEVIELRCTVGDAIVIHRGRSRELVVMDVGDGRLAAVPSLLGRVHLEYLGFPHERLELVLATRSYGPAELLSYRGEGDTVAASHSILWREAAPELRGLPLPGDCLVFNGALDTCLRDLRAALSGASDDQIPSKSA